MNDDAIEIRGLKKAFGEKEVLRNVNLTLRKGENLVVLGKSGTGKSVIIKCIVRLITPDEGDISIFGQSMSDIDDKALLKIRKKIGFLFQSAALYDSMSVRENLLFAMRTREEKLSSEESEKLVLEALENVGLESAIEKMPSELSGGMRKRLGLARTLILKPAIMLYDEPTTGLDSITSREISKLILEVQKKNNTSSIIITHDMPCAKMTANRIAVINEGEFIAVGSYAELENSEDPFVRSFFEGT